MKLRIRPSRRAPAIAAAAVVAIFAVAACGSSSKNTSATTAAGGSGSSAAPATSAPPAGSTLKLGAIVDEDGPCLPGPTQVQGQTISVWENYVNGHGGISGHPVHVTVINTSCDPGKAAAAAQTLLSQHVLAIIDGDSLDAAWQKTVDAAHVPVLCGIQNGNGFTCQADANFFPSGTTVLAGIYGNMYSTKQAGATSYGVVYCTEVAACKQALPVFEGFAKELGLGYPNPVAASETAPNYTAACVTMQQQHATAIFGAGPPSTKLSADCARQGYKPIYAQSMGTWQRAYLAVPTLNGTTGDTAEIPWFLQTNATAAFHTAVGNLLATANTPYEISTTWAALLLFQYALANAGANPTSQDVYTGLYAMHGQTLGGFAPPLTFTQGKPTTVPCFFQVQIKNGAYVAPTGATPACQPATPAA